VNVLTVNCGSSSLKFRVVDADPDHPAGEPLPWQLDGAAERIGREGSAISFTDQAGSSQREDRAFATH
jgi:acetate kinase